MLRLLLFLYLLLFLSMRSEAADFVSAIQAKADKGDAVAERTLGYWYQSGQFVKQDYAEALKWYRKASDQGEPDAEYWLGFLYFLGHGVAKDTKTAYFWMSVFEQNDSIDPSRGRQLGNLVDRNDVAKGLTTEEKAGEDTRVKEWLRVHQKAIQQARYDQRVAAVKAAAEQGDARQEYWLGRFYGRGFGVSQDYVEAYFWLSLAASRNIHDALTISARDATARRITAEQKASADKRVAEWLKDAHFGEPQ